MNKFDFVELINLKDEYKLQNLYLNVKGFVIEDCDKISKVLFFNEFNEGDYAFLKIFNEDLKISKEQPSKQFIDFMKSNVERFTLREKGFKLRKFKAYERVELLVEDGKYTKFGIHKGDIGTIMEDVAVQDYMLVDFGRLDKNNNFYGDCISVNIKDLKVLERNKD